jgi:iron complex outermembrane receptor protein
MNPTASRIATLMGSASFLTLTSIAVAQAQQQTAQAQMAQAAPAAIPEQVLITGSLIHGTAAVGVPVTNLGAQDFTETGNVSIGDLFRTVPLANVSPGPSAVNSGGHQEREIRVNIRGLDQTGPRTLLMVDGVKFPPQADGLCAIDPSIIPALALDRVDILADGASATYGSDAIAGVVNIILKRNYDGAVTLLHFSAPTDGGGQEIQASQLWGRTWEGGDITLTYEYSHEQPIKGTVHSNFTMNYTPWGLDNQIPIGASLPGTITPGAPVG